MPLDKLSWQKMCCAILARLSSMNANHSGQACAVFFDSLQQLWDRGGVYHRERATYMTSSNKKNAASKYNICAARRRAGHCWVSIGGQLLRAKALSCHRYNALGICLAHLWLYGRRGLLSAAIHSPLTFTATLPCLPLPAFTSYSMAA